MIYKGLKKVEMSKTQKMRVVNIFLAAGAVVAQEEESTTIGLDLSDFERGRNKKKQQVSQKISLVFQVFKLLQKYSK